MRGALRGFILVYDANCGPCTRFKQVVQFLDAHRSLRFESLTQADDEYLLDGVPGHERHGSFHLVSPRGEVLSGAQAIPTLIAQLPLGRQVSILMTGVPGGVRALSFAYRVFSRLHGAGSCRYNLARGPSET
jgi:predicted DCC family thiol-disulfide oxidoreductase YuxK